ncbi:MAG TPA: mechanosensitive ion channel [candidate division Zixibacteria bacterium]|nr:mechanosensitive ion channel [candidate division Zixibacteria bacterium]
MKMTKIKLLIVSAFILCGALMAGDTVFVGQTRLFTIEQEAGGATAAERARKATQAIESVMSKPDASMDSIYIRDLDSFVAIDFGNSRIFTVYPADTTGKGIPPVALAGQWRQMIIEGIEAERQRSVSAGNIARLALGVLFPLLVLIVYLLVQKLYSGLCNSTVKREGYFFRGIKFRGVEIMPARIQVSILLKIYLFLKWLTLVVIYYAMILLFFHLFPATESSAQSLVETSIAWLKNVGNLLIDVAKFVLLGFVFYIVARAFWGISDMVFRHYESPTTMTKIPEEALAPLRRVTKGIIAFVFIILMVAAIPGSGEYFALGLLVAVFIVVSVAALPFISSGIAGLSIIIRRKIKVGDTISTGGTRGKVLSLGVIWSTLEIENGRQLLIMNKDLLENELIFESGGEKGISE